MFSNWPRVVRVISREYARLVWQKNNYAYEIVIVVVVVREQ
jgi:hypothetical protein